MAKKLLWFALPIITLAAAGYYYSQTSQVSASQTPKPKDFPTTNSEPAHKVPSNPIVAAAREQLINPAHYSGAYYKIDYPMGDVPADRGACTDVIIRALRKVKIDLQKEIQEDADKQIYPAMMLARDKSIDHRRCPNQIQYFSRHAEQFPVDSNQIVKNNIKPGDIIFWKLPDNKDHVGIASDQLASDGHPLVIHNIGPTASEQDVLFAWKIVAHFRVNPKPPTPNTPEAG